ncbi:hypothetical protein EXIGLDRAFT_719391 [Exidia glandulosa HHB12029]|uniref:Uncharacterized protein n=1 Tax=Exidia glandulosa HHB12029 TaxID=1314781 RepID=A0A165H1T4_EXIGL|nr:hypothetical protein EXIGLDRAFT_719391 [Exidia glandulosa HHB12029]
MPLYLLDDLAFQVFEHRMGVPLLHVPLLNNENSNTKTPNLVHPDTVPHLRLHHFVDACRLAFGAFNLGPAGEDPAFLPNARRLDVYRVEGTSMASQRLEEDEFSSNLKPKSGIILDVYTYNNGEKESVDLGSQPAALEAIFEYINENHEVKKEAAFPGMVAPYARTEATCMFTGEEPILCAMHIFERRWSSPMLRLLSESSARVNAQFQAAIGNVHDEWYQTANVFVPAWQRLALTRDSVSPIEDSLNAAFGSPTCHHLLDGMYMVVHMGELLYLDRQGSSTMQFTTGATNEPRIVPVDDKASLLWAMRYTIAIFTRYGTPELREIMMSKPTWTPAQNDQGKKRKRDSSTSPGPPPKRRDGDDSQRDPDDSVGSSHSTLADASPEELKEMVVKLARCASPARALPLQPPSDSASSENDSSDDEASMSDGLVYMGGVKIVDPDPECIALDMEAVRIGALVLSSVFEQVGRA